MSEEVKPGDVVYVPAIDERWTVRRVIDGYIECCGWPRARVRAEDVRVLWEAEGEQKG